MTSINNAFIQPLLISRGASQLALGLFISGSSLFNFGAGWVGPTVAARVGNTARTALTALGIGRIIFLILTAYLLVSGNARPELLIILVLLWGLGEGLALPLWTSFLAGMVPGGERGRWISMRAQSATILTLPILVAILLIVLFASKDRALPLAYGVAAVGAITSWIALRRLFWSAPVQPLPPKRSLTHIPESSEARRFLVGVFTFWFASALTWPIIPRYITTDLDAPTIYFAISQIVGAVVAIIMQPRWGRMSDASGASRILLMSGAGSALVPLLWVFVPVYWLGFGVDALAFCVWPGHILGLTIRAVELVDDEADRPMMLGWTNLAQGAGACISPLLASILVGQLSVPVILMMAFGLRMLGTLVMSGVIGAPARQPLVAPA
jgi:MFS family permease